MSTSPDNPPLPPQRSDVMISYSRCNVEFATRLKVALEKKGYSTWIDRDDMHVGEDWWKQIQKGIAEARAVIFIASPHSLTSPVCHWELDHAFRHRQSIIPLAYHNNHEPLKGVDGAPLVDPMDKRMMPFITGWETRPEVQKNLIPPHLSKPVHPHENWISLTNTHIEAYGQVDDDTELDFDILIQHIIARLEKYHEYWDLHNELSRRAYRWRDGGFKTGDLLGNRLLGRAEKWIEQDPPPNQPLAPPHTQNLIETYIRRSRQARNRWLRSFITVVMAACVVLGIVTIAATQAKNRANREADRANMASTQVAIRLVEAIEQRNEVQRVLQTQTVEREMLTVPVGTQPNQPLLLGSELWVTDRGDGLLWRLRSDNGQSLGDPLPVGTAPQSPLYDGRYVWVTGAKLLFRFEPADPDQNASVMLDDTLRLLVPTENWVWTVGENGTVSAIQVDTLDIAVVDQLSFSSLPLVANNTYAWVVDEDALELHQLDPQAGVIATLDINPESNDPVLVGDYLWLTDRQSGDLWQIASQDITQVQHIPLGKRLGKPVFDGSFLWIPALGSSEVIQFDPVTNSLVRRFAINDTPWAVQREGIRLWVMTGNRGLLSFSVETGELLSATPDVAGSLLGPVADGLHLWFVNTMTGGILVIDQADGQIRHQFAGCNQPSLPVFDGANMWLACGQANQLLRIPALLTYSTTHLFASNDQPLHPVYDGQYLWVALQDAGNLVQFESSSGFVIREISLHVSDTEKLSAPIWDGRYLWVLTQENGEAIRVDPEVNPALIERVPVGGKMLSAKMINGHLWVNSMNFTGDDLVIIDRQSLDIIAHHDMGPACMQVAYEEGDAVVWASGNTAPGTVYELDAHNGKLLQETPLDGAIGSPPLLTDDAVWVTTTFGELNTEALMDMAFSLRSGPSQLYRLNRQSGIIEKSIRLNEGLTNIPTPAGNYIWVTYSTLDIFENPSGESIAALDPQTLETIQSWGLCNNPTMPFYNKGLIWFSCYTLEEDDIADVLAIDAATLQQVSFYQDLGHSAWPAQQINEDIWLVFQGSESVAIFSAQDGKLRHLVGVGHGASQPTLDNQGFVWIANANDNTVQRVFYP